MLLVFNKTDVCEHDFAVEWMGSFEAFHAALDAESTYASSLSRSLSLVRHMPDVLLLTPLGRMSGVFWTPGQPWPGWQGTIGDVMPCAKLSAAPSRLQRW